MKKTDKKLRKYINSKDENFEPNYNLTEFKDKENSLVAQVLPAKKKLGEYFTRKRIPLEESQMINEAKEYEAQKVVMPIAIGLMPQSHDIALKGSLKNVELLTNMEANLDKAPVRKTAIPMTKNDLSIDEFQFARKSAPPNKFQEKLMQESGKTSDEVLNSCYIMEHFIERLTKNRESHFPSTSTQNYRSRGPAIHKFENMDLSRLDQTEDYAEEPDKKDPTPAPAAKILQRHQTNISDQERNFALRPIENLEYELEDYKSFDSNKIVFRKKKKDEKIEKKMILCGINCQVM